MVEILPEFITAGVVLVAVLAEWLHHQRLKRVERLIFGPQGIAVAWTMIAPMVRIAGIGLATWGFTSLWLVVESQIHNKQTIDDSDYKHLVLVVDISPSMHLKDAGPDSEHTRRQRASDILQSLFSRIPMRQFKITFIAVYTDAKMMLEDSKDHQVVQHMMEKMPLWHAYKPGKTKLMSGIRQAVKVAKPWNPNSTCIIMLTDGDTVPATGMPTLPASVKDFFVIGVGDPTAGSFIDGHQSRQDVNTLRQVANRMRGTFHNGNKKHMTSQMVAQLAQQKDDQTGKVWARREWSLAAAVLGSALYSILPLALHYFGTAYVGGASFSGDRGIA